MRVGKGIIFRSQEPESSSQNPDGNLLLKSEPLTVRVNGATGAQLKFIV
jgi:hypothetical protein